MRDDDDWYTPPRPALKRVPNEWGQTCDDAEADDQDLWWERRFGND